MPQPQQRSSVILTPGARVGLMVLSICLALPAVMGLFADHDARSKWEKRDLASWEAVVNGQSLKARFDALSRFIDDHVGFALVLNRTYRKMLFYGFGDSPIANVDVGDDGFVFLNSHAASRAYAALRKLCRTGGQRAEATREGLADLARVAAARGVATTVAVVPSKILLYADRLPPSVPRDLRDACLQQPFQDTVAGIVATEGKGSAYRVFYPFEAMYALRDSEAFYPPGNFHANSRINHEFAGGLLLSMGINPGPGYEADAALVEIRSDLSMLGFERRIKAWTYGYEAYKVNRRRRNPAWVKSVYSAARDFSLYEVDHPASRRRAVLLSNSFGAYVADDIAPGFERLYHVNVNHLKSSESAAFLATVLAKSEATDLIFLVHDAGLPSPQLRALVKHSEHGSAD